MGATSVNNLTSRLDAVVEEARGRIGAFQEGAEAKRAAIAARFQQFLPIAERIAAIAKEKLEQLKGRLQFDVKPSHIQTERLYSRAVTLDLKTDLASVVRLAFRLTHDADVSHILLDYDVEIIPVFFRFNSHEQLAMPLESYDEATAARWLDDRIVEFANVYLELHATKQYQERVLVPDPVAGVSFPKFFAAGTLEHGGRTHHFISEETRREFAKRNGLTL